MQDCFNNFARAADSLNDSAHAASITFTAWMRYRSNLRREAAYGRAPSEAAQACRTISIEVLTTRYSR